MSLMKLIHFMICGMGMWNTYVQYICIPNAICGDHQMWNADTECIFIIHMYSICKIRMYSLQVEYICNTYVIRIPNTYDKYIRNTYTRHMENLLIQSSIVHLSNV